VAELASGLFNGCSSPAPILSAPKGADSKKGRALASRASPRRAGIAELTVDNAVKVMRITTVEANDTALDLPTNCIARAQLGGSS
jgi:hypothetical protein